MDFGLTGRRALIGGASSGLGLATARALAAEGSDLLLWARDPMRLRRVADELREEYEVEVVTVTADARRPGAAAAVADRVEVTYGGIDILVLNAGGPPFVDPLRTVSEDWQVALQLLTVTPIDLATRLLPGMRAQRYGRVIAILSSSIREPTAELSYASAGRSALATWLKTISRETAEDGVTVNGVLAGLFATPRMDEFAEQLAERAGTDASTIRQQGMALIPAGRAGEPAELAAVVSFLASEPAGYVTGSTIACDGGLLRSIT